MSKESKYFEAAANEHLQSWKVACDALAGLPSATAFISWLDATENNLRQRARVLNHEGAQLENVYEQKPARAEIMHKVKDIQERLMWVANAKDMLKKSAKFRPLAVTCAKQLAQLLEANPKTKASPALAATV